MNCECRRCGTVYLKKYRHQFACKECTRIESNHSGTARHGHKLSHAVLNSIEARVMAGATARALMDEFGISKKTAYTRRKEICDKMRRDRGT